jgi:hypothetical protein
MIDRTYPLEKTGEAFEFFSTGKVQGKIIIAA